METRRGRRTTKPSLYLHIPFCRRKCDYCNFYSLANPDRTTEEVYIRHLVEDMRRAADLLSTDSFASIYIGGGTPSLLSIPCLTRLLSAVETFTGNGPVEFTVEANPESCSDEFLGILREHGVGRLSLGVQSFHPASRRYIGRSGSSDVLLSSLHRIAQCWPGSLNIDLIRGLPDTVSLSLDEEFSSLGGLVRGDSPLDHLSLYDLSVEEGTPLKARLATARNDNTDSAARLYGFDIDCSEEDRRLLESFGFRQYEVSNFAKPGRESRHNRGYWEMEPYLGLGPGAASLLFVGNHWRRYRVEPDLEAYLQAAAPENGEHDECRVFGCEESLSKLEFFMDHLIMGVRQNRGLAHPLILDRFGASLEEIIPATLARWAPKGARLGGVRFLLTGEAFQFQNRFLREAWEEAEGQKRFA